MKQSIVSHLAVVLLLGGVGAGFASAQFGPLGQAPQRPRPTVSPLINQGVGGGINASSYYGIIKPQYDTSRTINQLQTGLQILNADGSLKGAIDQGQGGAVATMQTGHAATYFNYSHYFPMTAGSTGSSSGSGGFGTGVGGANGGIRPFYGPTMNSIGR